MAAASPTNALRYVRVEHTALEHVKYNHPILRCVWTNPIDPLRSLLWIARHATDRPNLATGAAQVVLALDA